MADKIKMRKSLPEYKHIIWDWNGTLLDDVAQCVATVNLLLERSALPLLTIDRYRELVDFPVIDFYQRIGFDFSRVSFDDLAQDYMALYVRALPRCQLQPHAHRLLDLLIGQGVTHSVLSAYQQQRLEEAIDYFQLRRYFIRLIGLDDYYARSKLANGRRWMGELSCPPSEVLFVGDTLHDFEVARGIGVDCVLLATGHQSRARLAVCSAPILDSLDQLTGYLPIV